MLTDFSYDNYRSLLKTFIKSHAFLTFKDFRNGYPDDPFLILRHDIDLSPEAALRMAEIEADMGIKANYFFLFSSPWYNLFDEDNILIPRLLTEMGHEVGLHYDMALLEKVNKENPLEVLTSQSELLSELCGSQSSKVTSIAMHNPSLSGKDSFRGIKEFTNAYDDNFIKRIKYFSDSCGAWRDDFVACLRKKSFPSQMQLLTHPFFWGKKSKNRWERFEDFIQNSNKQLLIHSEKLKKVWSEHPGVRMHDIRA